MSTDTIELLKKQLLIATQAGERAEILCALSEKLTRDNPRQSCDFAWEALDIAVRIEDKYLQGRSHYCIAIANLNTGNSDEALKHGLEAQVLFYDTDHLSMMHRCNVRMAIAYNRKGQVKQAAELLHASRAYFRIHNDLLQEAHVLLVMGDLSRGWNRYAEALEYTLAALDIYQKEGEQLDIGRCCQTLSSIYYEHNYMDMEKAIQYMERYRDIMHSLDDKRGEMIALSRLGKYYAREQRFEDAFACLHRAEMISDKCGYYQEHIYRCFAVIYSLMGQWDKVTSYVLKALPIVNKQNDRQTAKFLYIDLGTAYAKLNNNTKAIECLTRALEIESTIREGHIEPITGYNCTINLAEAYESMGDTATALKYHKEGAKYKELMSSLERERTLAEMQAKFDVETAEREKELFRVKNVELSAALDEVRRLNDNLTKVNNEKNEVLGIVAHDLKSPLSGVRMVASLVKDHYRKMPAGELEHQLDVIVDSTERMLSISSSLLKAQQIETGDVYGASARVNVSEVVSRLAEDYRPSAEAKQIDIDVQCDVGVELVCSEEALRQSVENLVSNAVKFTPPGKKVCVRVKKSKKKILVEVQDEGPGIGKSEKRKLYGKYSRLSARPTGGESSTGLGLWIAKRAAEALRGRIRCASTLGAGTIFSIEIPVQK